MKIQCDVCERAEATVICCADEAALCAKCDVEVHEANRLASKHQRLLLQNLSNKLPRCDICQEKAGFIFCVEDRALFCRECDEAIHSNGSLSGNHQRLLVTGIQVALTSIIARNSTDIAGYSDPPNPTSQPLAKNLPPTSQPSTTYTSSPWVVDDLLQFSDFEANEKKETMGFGELDWFSDIGLFGDQIPQAAAEVPQLRVAQQPCNSASYRPPLKSSVPLKRARIEISDDEDFFTVPDLG